MDVGEHRDTIVGADDASADGSASQDEELLCDICSVTKPDISTIFCASCSNNVCEECADDMVAEGGEDCGNTEEYFCPECWKHCLVKDSVPRQRATSENLTQ
jgi:hypothetical protein